MSQLDNLKAFDPFADASKGDEESGQEGVVHIRFEHVSSCQLVIDNCTKNEIFSVVMLNFY